MLWSSAVNWTVSDSGLKPMATAMEGYNKFAHFDPKWSIRQTLNKRHTGYSRSTSQARVADPLEAPSDLRHAPHGSHLKTAVIDNNAIKNRNPKLPGESKATHRFHTYRQSLRSRRLNPRPPN